MKRFVAVALIALVALAVPQVLASMRTTTRNERAARSAAQQMLAKLRLPAGAKSAKTDPSRASLLGHAPDRPATSALVDAHSFWRVPGSPSAVLRWVEAHPPEGSTRDMSGGLVRRSGARATWDGYDFGPVPGVLSTRSLLVEVARASGGGTAVRADAEVVWVVPKPPTERIPRPVRGALGPRGYGGLHAPDRRRPSPGRAVAARLI